MSQKQACFAHTLTVRFNVQFARIATNVATRQRFGRLAYPVAAPEAVSAHKALEVELHFDGLFFPPAHQFRHRSTTASPTPINAVPALRCRVFQVTVINTPLFGGRWQFSNPAASFSDRLLDIVVFEERDKREALEAEREAVIDLRNRGEINDEVLRRIERELDLEERWLAGEAGKG